MVIFAIILKVLGLIGITGAIINIVKKKEIEKNKKTLKGAIIFLVIGVFLGAMASPETDSQSAMLDSQPIPIEHQQRAINDWVKKLNDPIQKMTNLTPFFEKISVGLKTNQLSRAEAQVSMDQLSNYLSDVSSEFRSLKMPDEKLFSKEQNESFKFIKTNLQDASNNYSKAADHLSRFIATADINRITDMTNYMNNANAHTTKATEELNSLMQKLNIKRDQNIKSNDEDTSINLK